MSVSAFPPPRFVDVGSDKLAYREWGGEMGGASRPVALLIHGIVSSSLSWVRVAPLLARTYRVIATDNKGHGDSARPTAGYRLEDQAAETRGLCEALGVRPAVVIGHSWGGAIALCLATAAADGPQKLVLEDPALALDPARRARAADTYVPQVGLSVEAAQLEAEAARRPGWTDEDVAGRADSMMKGSPAAVRAVFTVNDPWDLRPLFGKLRCPTLLVRAEVALGGIVSPEVAAQAQAACPHLRVVTVPGADHNIHRTKLEAFMAAVNGFIAEG